MSIYFKKVADGLVEFSSKEVQELLWNKDHGNNGSHMSSFVEAGEGLFGDSGLSNALKEGDTEGINPSAVPLLKELDEKLRLIEYPRPEEQVINDPLMQEVRILAAKLLVIGVESGKPLGYTH